MVTRKSPGGEAPGWSSRIVIDNGDDEDAGAGLQECRGSLIGTRIWVQMVSSEYMVLQNRVDVELTGVGFNGSITGVGVRFPGVIV